ncbi:MAG TPA: SidA/IucD/PvdA family monooxygenase [Ginsengibacter sp.]|nr:SidA/IucD/PvdA family monooxygenase [Ginsengibacter sp.]
METDKIYDIVGIGIGPFNLGLAALLHDLPELNVLFIDSRPGFNWHPGLLLPTAWMQVPFYADLVSIVNPKSDFTYFSYLKTCKRLFKFANNDNIYPLRIEYNRYCQWVAAQLLSLRFSHHCEMITWDHTQNIYTVYTNQGMFHGKHIVLGTGTTPVMPESLLQLQSSRVIHAKDYLFHKNEILSYQNVTVLGSGQSAAEVFRDLLDHADDFESLSWFTRSNRFHPMDISRLTTEMTSFDYIDYFFSLSPDVKSLVLQQQQYLYKGINAALIAELNDMLYIRDTLQCKPTPIHANCSLLNAAVRDEKLHFYFFHIEKERSFTHITDLLIAATGYEYKIPACILPLLPHIQWDDQNRYRINRNYSIDSNNSLFVQNADLHTHGFNAADLGIGPLRNATIINTTLNQEVFTMEKNSAFQSFDTPPYR